MNRSGPAKTISEAEIETFHRDGVVCLRQVIEGSWIHKLQQASEDIRSKPSGGAFETRGASGEGRYTFDRFLWTFNEDFKAFAFASRLPEIAAKAMRSRTAYLMLDLIFTKEPKTGVPTPWHHDQPYAWYDGNQVCQFWAPLDRVDIESGVLEFVRGSHRSTRWFNPAAPAGGDALALFPEIEVDRANCDVVHFDMEPGDCLLFHELTLHAAPANSSPRLRRGVAVHYAGDDATYAVRERGVFPIRDPGLKHGDSFEGCDLFPRVWPKI